MPFKEKVKRFFGFGDYGLYRNPSKANQLHTAQISTEIDILGNMFKSSGLAKEIENEKFQIKKEFEEFHNKFINKEFHSSDEKMTEAQKINDEFTIRIENLKNKIAELDGIKIDIKDLTCLNKEQEKEFNKEMSLHRIRFDEDYKNLRK